MKKISFPHFLAFFAVLFGVMWTEQSQANAPTGQYIVSNGTVFDTKSQLTWEQAPLANMISFDAATAYCQGLMLAGGKWRVPSMKELQTIIDETTVDPAIDLTAFPATMNDKYWSSTRWADAPTDAWSVRFDYGSSSYDSVANLHYVRCVK